MSIAGELAMVMINKSKIKSLDKKIYILIRNDDFCALSDPKKERKILEIFEKYNIPQVISTIPNVTADPHDAYSDRYYPLEENPKIISLLNEFRSKGLVEIVQHGYLHQTNKNYPSQTDQITNEENYFFIDRKIIPFDPLRPEGYSEFNSLSYDVIKERIKLGRTSLERLFDIHIDTFVAPWNSIDTTLLEALRDCGFKNILCGSKTFRMKPLTIINCYHENIFGLASIVYDVDRIDETALTQILYHSWELKDEDIINLDSMLKALVTNKNIRFITISDLHSLYPDIYSLLNLKTMSLSVNEDIVLNNSKRMPPYYILSADYYKKKIYTLKIRDSLKVKVKGFFGESSDKKPIAKEPYSCLISKENKIDFSRLLKLARGNPFDKRIAYQFFNEYERLKEHNIDEEQIYLELKYFYDIELRHRYLNELSKIFLKKEKELSAFACLVESLRLRPDQEDIFKIAESLRESKKSNFPDKLRDGTCTVSIIMPIYNRLYEIKDAIRSVLEQTFQDFELIVINDGGTDEVKKIIDNFNSSKIKYYKLEKNIGQAMAMNVGLLKAEGKYIAYLDDDDIYYSDHLETLVKSLESSNYKVAYTNTKGVKGVLRNGRFEPVYTCFNWGRPFDKNILVSKIFIGNLSIMYERNLIAKVGLFNDLRSKDWDMWLRLSLKYDFLYINKDTGEYRLKNSNHSHSDKLGGYFSGGLVSEYHLYFQGDIAFIKYYLNKNETKKAYELYKNIVYRYKGYFKTVSLVKELLEIANELKDVIFIKKLSKDYFLLNPRSCIGEIIKRRSHLMLFSVIHLLPRKIIRSASARTRNYTLISLKSISKKYKGFSKTFVEPSAWDKDMEILSLNSLTNKRPKVLNMVNLLYRSKEMLKCVSPKTYSKLLSLRNKNKLNKIEEILSCQEPPRYYDSEKIFNQLQSRNFNPPTVSYEYCNTWRRSFERVLGLVLKLNFLKNPGLKIFEAGCGNGMIAYAFSSYGHEVTLSDIEDWREKKAKNMPFVQVDLCSEIPVDSNSFDFAYSFDTFEHLYDPEVALKELIRICKKGGYIYLDFGPLYASAWGLHAFKTIRIPYAQFLFSEPFLLSKIKELGVYDLGRNMESLQPCNRWKKNQFDSLWESSGCEIISSTVYTECSHLNVIRDFPHAFSGRGLSYSDLVTMVLYVTLRKR